VVARAVYRILSRLFKLIPDQKGQVVVYFTLLAPVMMGLVGLSLEGGRLLMLNSQLQDLADAAALAGAKELDGRNDAITRATNAAETRLNNDTSWSNVASLVRIQIQDPPVFYSALKGQPTSNPAPHDVTTIDPTKASYIKVTTITRKLAPAFLVAVGATSIAQTNATATAGSTYVACHVQPLMLCNPSEPDDFTATPGQLFGFTPVGGGNQQLSPGGFSLLDPSGSTSSGATAIRNLLSQTSPNFCYVDSVSPRPGQASSDVAAGINVRLDIQPNGNITGLDQTPAPNVVKGMLPLNNCDWNNPTMVPNAELPGDSDMTRQGSVLIGSTMDMTAANAYWNYHHGANWPTSLVTGQPLTRYAAYQLERGLTGPAPPWVNIPPGENPAPQCAPTAVRNVGDDTRRMISVAIVNCLANGIKGNSVASARSNMYADFFLSNPVLSQNQLNQLRATAHFQANVIYAEFVRMFTPQSDGSKLHQIVQLYRD
jgi:Flp pilus assembly protein TadG